MTKAKQRDKAMQVKLNAASSAAKAALEQWRKKYVGSKMKPLMWAFDYKELNMIVKLLKSKIYNQTKNL